MSLPLRLLSNVHIKVVATRSTTIDIATAIDTRARSRRCRSLHVASRVNSSWITESQRTLAVGWTASTRPCDRHPFDRKLASENLRLIQRGVRALDRDVLGQ